MGPHMKAGRMLVIIAVLCSAVALPGCTGGAEPTMTGNSSLRTSSPAVIETTSDNLTMITVTSAAPDKSTPRFTETTTTPVPATTNTTAETTPADDHVFRVVGYITHWHLSRLSQFDLEGLTHLIWQGVEVTSGEDPTLRVAEDAGWRQIETVVETGHRAGVSVLVSLIGPWDTSSLNEIWASPELRKELIDDLVDLIEDYGLDGIDVDNENKCDARLYKVFIDELYEALAPLDKLITLAAHPNRVCVNKETAEKLDFINLMTYDLYTGKGYPYHSTYEESVDSMELWAGTGIDRQKLNMGIPFYGRDATGNGYEYRWIVDSFEPTHDQNEVLTSDRLIWWNGPSLV